MKKIISILALLGFAIPAGQALAQSEGDSLRVTIGLKVWANKWETWTFPGGTSYTSETKWPVIPNISLNYGNFFGSFGYFAKTNYSFPSNPFLNAKREEYDINAGYWILRGETGGRLGLTLGYKQVNQDFGGTAFDKIRGATIGAVGIAPIAGQLSLYANGAIGPTKSTFPGFSGKGYYWSGEAGLAYPIFRGTTLTAGYKVQIVDVGCSNSFTGYNNRCRDTTNGPIVGVSYTF